MSLRLNITETNVIQDRKLFFDANVLLYVFGSTYGVRDKRVKAYNAIFHDFLKMKSVLCIDILVLSEFINKSLRLGHDKYLKNNRLDKNECNFKKFRSTDDGIQLAQEIENKVKERILKHFTIIGKLFNESDIISISLAGNDFNDELIIKICREHQCVLITNDADFSNADIDILTANNNLLIKN